MNAANASGELRRRVWRWHFLAAFLVVPFVLWQSLTGTLYVWSEAYVDARHPQLRFVPVGESKTSLDEQAAAARAVAGGRRLTDIALPADPARSTMFAFEDGAVPRVIFVDPYSARRLGELRGVDWTPGWTRKLHGGWPLGDPGSWLLELGACWTIVMVLTGVYLWWPRDGRSIGQVLVPRWRAGGRLRWRDLHACVAVWFSLITVLFLLTALPWTSFWGGRVLQPLQQALRQSGPTAAGFAPVFAGSGGAAASLQQLLDEARTRSLDGDLTLSLVDGPPGSAVAVRTRRNKASERRYLLLDRADGATLGYADWRDFPLLAKTVATGVDIHEARFFGSAGPWLNTAFAGALVWMSVTGFMTWWRRKPERALGVPPAARAPWPAWLKAFGAALFVALPLLALSVSLLWLAEKAWLRAANAR
ncbi:MAG TPA: PepSY domain-containing protein [Luteimonas sp.]|nr:PepSY domain-containing protein [Luteimonas sp.]